MFAISTPPNQEGATQSDEALAYMSGVTHQEPKRLWFHYTLCDLISYLIYYTKTREILKYIPSPQATSWTMTHP